MNASPLSSPADVWANLRRLYPVYCTLAREFVIDVEPCIELEDAHESPATEAITQAGKWFASMDEKIQIPHLRQFVQTSSEVSEPVLRDLLLHSLSSQQRDRDKVDFLLVQLFSEHAPENCGEADLTLEA